MNIDYKCKFCGRTGWVEAPEGELGMFRVPLWTPLLCCDRCADYRRVRRKVWDAVERCCVALLQLRLCVTLSHEQEAILRQAFTRLTKRFAGIVCDYFRQARVWEADFVEMLMAQPAKYQSILGGYERGMGRELQGQMSMLEEKEREK